VLNQGLQVCVVHLIGDAERLGGRHHAVRQKGETDVLFFNGLAELWWLVRRNTDNLKSELAELGLGVAQLNQLPVTMRSPAATIKH